MSVTNMMRCVTEIKFKASPESKRDLQFTFNFVNEFEFSDSWVDLTNQAKITLPKNIYVIDKNGNKLNLGGTEPNKLIDNLFRRGDSVSINYGYYTYENGNEVLDMPENPIFEGFITAVGSKRPIVLECEDNMWKLKQIPCKPQVWPKEKSVEDLLKTLLQGTDFTVNGLTKTTVGDLVIQDETVAQLLARLQKDFHFEAYFKGNELRIGSLVYIEDEAKTFTFEFQKNIISDELVFQRKDDVKLSAICESVNTVDGGTNKKGQTKTKEERLTVLVYYDKTGVAQYKEKKKGEDLPENVEGERRKLFYPNVKSAKDLFEKGIAELEKYYYTGFKGKFTTFAIPYVQMGDNVIIKDKLMPDRDGKYKVKSVNYTGGINGHRQIIELHYKMR